MDIKHRIPSIFFVTSVNEIIRHVNAYCKYLEDIYAIERYMVWRMFGSCDFLFNLTIIQLNLTEFMGLESGVYGFLARVQ